MKVFFYLIVFCCSSVLSQTIEVNNIAHAQVNYRFSHLSIADGLSPGTVNCFYKDSKGFIWIGTSSGLNRYDGYEIKTFNPAPIDSLAFQSKDYKKIFEDPLGNIWVKTSNGINIFDPQTEKFSSDQSTILNKLGVPQKPVKEIYKDSIGNFWFIQEGFELIKYDPHSQKIIRLSLKEKHINYGVISCFRENSDGDFWIIYANGVFEKIDGESLEITFSNTSLAERFKNEPHDYKMVIDKQDDLWIHLFGDYGLFYYQNKKNNIRNFKKESKTNLSSNLITDVVVDPDGKIWVGTDHGGVNVINKKDFSIDYVVHNPEIENSLSHNSATSLYCDYDGIIWVGTFKSGVDYFHKNIFKFPHYENLISNPHSLPYNDINVFEEDSKGNLWIGTNGGGLLYFDRKSQKYTQYKHDPNEPKSISGNVIVSLLQDSNGNLWVGTYLEGLNKFDGKTFRNYRHDSTDPISLGGNSIWELFEDSNSNIWIGTLNGGLEVYDEDQERFYNSKDFDIGNPLLNNSNYIKEISEDKEGFIWVGGGNGLDVFNPLTGENKHFSFDSSDPYSLRGDNILTIFRDSEDHMWIGTEEGLNLYNPEAESFYHYSLEDGLPGRNVISIVEDDHQDLWITSSYGMVQFKKNAKEAGTGRIEPNFRNYDDLDGLQGKLFNENAIFKTCKGEILVGGLNGYNIFDPKDFGLNTNPPKIIFTSFNLFNEEVKPHQNIHGRELLSNPIYETSKIKLRYDENLFSIEFAALDFFQPSKNRYKYKLEGFDQDWQSIGSNSRRVTYTNLDPGSYEFKVQASNNDQFWNDEGISLNIQVQPPFYRTVYAYIFYFLMVVGVLYISRRRLIHRQQKNFQVEQEKREAAHLHKLDLMKIRFFTNISHEFKTPLSLILAPLERLKQQQVKQEAKEQVETVHKNAQRLLNLINQILDLGNIQNDSLLSSSQGDIIEFIEQIVESFKSLAENKGIRLEFSSETKEFYTSFDMDKMDKILFNLLSNAVKFTLPEGKICVKVKIRDSSSLSKDKILEVTVKDSGIGISPEDAPQIFDRFFKVEQPREGLFPGSGIGLSLVKKYVELYNGTVTVESKPGKGSEFKLQIPLTECNSPAVSDQDHHLKISADNVGIEGNGDIVLKEELPSILIVEDDEELLAYLIKSLKTYFNVFVAANGEIGWKKVLAVKPDLIISDWTMPVMTGIDLCRKIKNDVRTKHIPFILLTAKHEEEKTLYALKIGVNDYITKPFNTDILLSRIQNLIAQRRTFQQVYSKKIKLQADEVEVESQDDKFVAKVLTEIEKNMGNSDFSVENLASQLGVSRTLLYNKLVTKLEKSPQELIKDLRLQRGKELLQKSQLTIAEVAFEVGFNNPKYFTKNFKKKFHILPSEFRSKHIGMLNN